jgi:hypothetical protein
MNIRRAAVLLAFVWATAWTAFGILASAGSGFFVPAAAFASLMLGAAALAWRAPIAGGALLVTEGVGAWMAFGPSWLRWSSAETLLLLCGTAIAPPVVSGLVCLVDGIRQRRNEARSEREVHLNI